MFLLQLTDVLSVLPSCLIKPLLFLSEDTKFRSQCTSDVIGISGLGELWQGKCLGVRGRGKMQTVTLEKEAAQETRPVRAVAAGGRQAGRAGTVISDQLQQRICC